MALPGHRLLSTDSVMRPTSTAVGRYRGIDGYGDDPMTASPAHSG